MKETKAQIYRRHRPKCKFYDVKNARAMLNCNCPLYGDGYIDGKRVLRKSLDTRNQAAASRRLGELMAKYIAAEPPAPDKNVSDAVEAFLAYHGVFIDGAYHRRQVVFSTYRKYRNTLEKLEAFCQQHRIEDIRDVGLEQLDAFRGSRKIQPKTERNELQLLRKFWSFCLKRKWVSENVAKNSDSPKNLPDNEIEPYTPLEEARILSACDAFGRTDYERRRARAIIQVQRFTALAISDVACLERSRLGRDTERRCWRILVRRQKNGKPVFLPLPDEAKYALDALPVPHGASTDCPYFFWNGTTSRRAVVGIAERTLSAVFKKSGVRNAGSHRFRHTVATRLLGGGASFEAVADILGNTPEIVRKHYGKWSRERQDRITDLMLDYAGSSRAPAAQSEEDWVHFGYTNEERLQLIEISASKLVRRGGLEPPRDCSR